MSDSISRQVAVNAMCELMHHWFGSDSKDEIREIKLELEKLPSSQPEIIRCKDCLHWVKRGQHFCEVWEYYISNEDFYCGCAVRMKGE